MRLIFKLCFRNIFRRKVRSILIILTIAVGVAGLLLVNAITEGVVAGFVSNAIRLDLGHINIQKPGFKEKTFLSLNLPYDQALFQKINRIPEVAASSPRIRTLGMAATAEYSSGVQIVGIDPTLEKKITVTSQKMIEGSYLSNDAHSIILGKALADKLHVNIGDKIILMAQDLSNAIGSGAFRVVGIFSSGSPEYDKFTVFITLPAAAEMLAMPGKISQIAVLLKNDLFLDSAQIKLKELVKDRAWDVLTWREIMPILVTYEVMIAWGTAIRFILIFICVAVAVANIMMVAVFERIKEFGILKAIGDSPLNVFKMIMLESFLLGVFGLAAGFTVGYGAILYFMAHPIDLGAFSEGLSFAGFDTKLYPIITLRQPLLACGAVLATCIASALYPAIKASRLKPVEAIRYQ